MDTKTKKIWTNNQKSIEDLHEESKTWVSEINFVDDEINFLNHLLSVKYIDTLYEGLSKKIEVFTKKMKQVKEEGKSLLKVITTHELLLAELIEKKYNF